MKSVMISIKPKWCELIASGKKTVEVRKTRPKIETPFKCYIYCTKGHLAMLRDNKDTEEPYKYDVWRHADFHESCGKTVFGGRVIGEFVCDFVNEYTAEFTDGNYHEDIRQVFEDGEAIITSNEDENPNNCFLCNRACLSFEDIKKYIGTNFHEKPFYGWHISNLVIYDKPKGLSDFSSGSSTLSFSKTKDGFPWKYSGITKPPQSWCYCEGIEE